MTQNKIIILIERLLERTLDKQVVWQKWSGTDEYKLDLKSGAITVDKWNHDYQLYAEVVLYNNNGDKIDVLSANDSDNQENFELISNFHSEIRRSHYKVDETIDGLLDEIGLPGIIGKEQEKKQEEDDLPF